MSMADSLSVVAADYTTTELSVAPQKTMTEQVRKSQIVYESDDGDPTVVSKSNKSIWTATLMWTALSETDAETIEDFYCDATKANGMERTFYWQHPKDPETYTVQFMTPLVKRYDASMPNYIGIASVQLRIIGTKT